MFPIEQLGLDFALDSAAPMAISKTDYEYTDGVGNLLPDLETGYELIYVPTVNGLPLSMTNFSGTSSAVGNPAPGCFPYQNIEIVINETGLLRFQWNGPCAEPKIQSSPVELLPFDQIQEIFGKMIFVKNADWQNINSRNGYDTLHDINIDKVRLTLMRVRDAHTLGPATIVPVWDFWGTDSWYTNDESAKQYFSDETPLRYEVQMTINAIDGTLIDRAVGY